LDGLRFSGADGRFETAKELAALSDLSSRDGERSARQLCGIKQPRLP